MVAKTLREIDELYAEYVSRLPDAVRCNLTVIYARYSTRFQDSIGDQVRVLLEHALLSELYVPREFIFFDLAVRGYKKTRVGLDGAEAILRQRKASTLLLFSTSRLFRKTYRTLEFVDSMHKGLGIRCIFAKSGVDTNDTKRWETLLAVQSMIDQFVVSLYVDNIHAAHEGLLRKQLVFGTLTFGYAGEVIDGEFTVLGRPRRRIIIDEEEAGIVRQVFDWFATSRLSVPEIVRRLNRISNVALPPHARSGMWTAVAVRHLLRNERYISAWKYGVRESVYVPDGDYVRQNLRSEPLAECQIDELRIVSDGLWDAAQKRIAERRGQGGRPPKDGDHASRPKILNGLLFCPGHETPQQLYVSGAKGGAMHCPLCARLSQDERALFSTVNRALATDLVCQKIGQLILTDPKLSEAVLAVCQQAAQAVAKPNPKRMESLRAAIKQHETSIEFTRRNVGETAQEQAEAGQFVLQLQRERASLQAELKQLTSCGARQVHVPSTAEVRALLEDVADHLRDAAGSDDLEEAARARKVVETVTGGFIESHQMGERAKKKGWVQLRFRLTLVPYLAQLVTGQQPSVDVESLDVCVDVRRKPVEDPRLEVIWRMYQAGMLAKEIGARLGIGKSSLTKLLKAAAARFGGVYVDGRERRAGLPKKQVDPTLRDKIENEVMELYHQNEMPMEDIARRFGVCKDTITAIVKHWHVAHGLPVPDGRTRRHAVVANRREANGNDDAQAIA